MAFLTSDVILDESMDRYETESVIMQLADGRYDPQWDNAPVKGDTVAIRLPVYARARRGEKAAPQQIEERLVNLVIPAAFGSDSFLSDRQLSMELNDFKDQVLNPHIDAISAAVAKAACQTIALGVSQFVGTPGITPTVLDTYQTAHTIMNQSGALKAGMGTNRFMLVDANMDQYAAAAGRTFLNPAGEISERYRTGSMAGKLGIFGGATWYMEQALYQQTIGTCTGAVPVVDGGNQSGNSITLSGFVANSACLNQGDKLQFQGAFMVHPVLGTVYNNYLAPFTVAANVVANGSGVVTVPLTEAIEFGTAYANVSALPANNATVYIWGRTSSATDTIEGQQALAYLSGLTFTLGMLMEKSALVYASPSLDLPSNADKLSGSARSKQMKIAMRVWRDADIVSGQRITRLDMLCGHLVGQPRRACLVCST